MTQLFLLVSSMRKTRFDTMNCSLARALDEIGDWWTLLILREITMGNVRFDGIQMALGIARNVLSARLTRLIGHGVLRQKPIARGRRRQVYVLTAKGEALLPALIALMQWGDRWISGRSAVPTRVLEAATGVPVRNVTLRSGDGLALRRKEIRFVAGPGARPETAAHLERLSAAEDEGRRRVEMKGPARGLASS